MSLFARVFPQRPVLLGMIHVWPGGIERQLEAALNDAQRLLGFDGVIVENYGWGYEDSNFANEDAALTIGQIARVLVDRLSIPVGINLLPNDYPMAFGVAQKVGASFIQLDHVTGEFQGVRSVPADEFAAMRRRYPQIAVLGGIQPKYYRLARPEAITVAAQRAIDLTDAIVVTGNKTGGETSQHDLELVRITVGDHPIMVGSGFNASNAQAQLALADGAIVGTAIKAGGVAPGEPIDDYLVTQLLGAVRVRS